MHVQGGEALLWTTDRKEGGESYARTRSFAMSRMDYFFLVDMVVGGLVATSPKAMNE